jgi:hypothetical protein
VQFVSQFALVRRIDHSPLVGVMGVRVWDIGGVNVLICLN